jgi:serine/threonine protein kinase
MDVPQFIAGRFRIECEIGTGGMGTVYRATHLGLERPVAVKIIKREFAGDRDVADRFLREARTMAKLRHPHAAMIFDAGNLPDGRHFIIMEFVEGHTLSEVLARQGPFSPERAVEIAIQICEVLEEAHQLGIIHRDLKPSNIMLNEKGVRVLDFGVAKVLASSTEVTATHATTGSGQIVGTPRYMSPEQCLGQRVGARSDLYSLGVLLYEMLSGRPPFIDAMNSAVLVKQATAAPPPLFQVCKNAPRPLVHAVHTLLAKRPDDRPRTASIARLMLAKSLTRADLDRPEIEPLSSTVAAVASNTNLILRAAAPLGIVLAFGALLLVWADRGETAADLAAAVDASKATQTAMRSNVSNEGNNETPEKEVKKSGAAVERQTKAQSVASLSPERARQVVASLAPGTIKNIQVVKSKSGTAMVALSEGRKAGNTHFVALEKSGDAFRVASRGQLDTSEFRRAKWTSERVDADEDGHDEVLFTGTNAQSVSGYRLVLYVPRTQQVFSLRVETKGKRPERALWSSNLLKAKQSLYRELLRQRANGLLAKAQKRPVSR